MTIIKIILKSFKFMKYRLTTLKFQDGTLLWGVTTEKFIKQIRNLI